MCANLHATRHPQQRLVQPVRLSQILPACSWIAVTPRPNVDVLLRGIRLDLRHTASLHSHHSIQYGFRRCEGG